MPESDRFLDTETLARDLLERRLVRQPLPNKVWIQLTDSEMATVKATAKLLKVSEAQTRRVIFLRGLQK